MFFSSSKNWKYLCDFYTKIILMCLICGGYYKTTYHVKSINICYIYCVASIVTLVNLQIHIWLIKPFEIIVKTQPSQVGHKGGVEDFNKKCGSYPEKLDILTLICEISVKFFISRNKSLYISDFELQ